MKINIGNNLKRLRKQREITQEDLANFIGVSFQAISKWERNEGYPDITTLPVIANFFGVSLDELVGMDEIKNESKLCEIKEKHRELASNGKIAEDIVLLREAVQIFPNDYWLLAELACFLDGFGDTEEEKTKNRNEAIKISERIIEFCMDTEIRSNVQCNVCFTLWRNGEKERAIELAKKLPGIYKTREMTLNSFLSGNEKVEECQTTIQKLCWAFWAQIKQLSETVHYTSTEKIELLQKGITIYKLVYDKGDYLFSNFRIYASYERMARICLDDNNIEEAVSYIEQAALHAIAFSSLSQKKKHESLLVDTLIYDVLGTSTSSEKNTCWYLKHNLENDEAYASVVSYERIKAVLRELEKYAN